MITFGSVCSGIEAASVAWRPLGWRAAWLAEIEPFPAAVLAHHYPDVPNLGDMTQLAAMIRAGDIQAPDVFCGGTPCQAFSVAGLRRSLDDHRGNLSLTFCEIADAVDAARHVRGEQPSLKGRRHVDHRTPLSKGGEHIASNLVIACATCNLQKGRLLPEQFVQRRTK